MPWVLPLWEVPPKKKKKKFCHIATRFQSSKTLGLSIGLNQEQLPNDTIPEQGKIIKWSALNIYAAWNILRTRWLIGWKVCSMKPVVLLVHFEGGLFPERLELLLPLPRPRSRLSPLPQPRPLGAEIAAATEYPTRSPTSPFFAQLFSRPPFC